MTAKPRTLSRPTGDLGVVEALDMGAPENSNDAAADELTDEEMAFARWAVEVVMRRLRARSSL